MPENAWDVRTADVHYRHEFRAADGTGQLTAHVFSAQGRTGWIVAEGCDLIAGAIVPGGNPTAWKTAREAADAAMAVWQDSMKSLRIALAPPDDDPTDAEIDELKVDILRGWADRYVAADLEGRLAALRSRHESSPPDEWLKKAAEAEDAHPCTSVGGLAADLGLHDDLTDEQITEDMLPSPVGRTRQEDAERDKFDRYLKRASAEVATWPEWKRNLLGRWPGERKADDLTDEQITEAAADAAWADTFGSRDDEPAPDFTIERRDNR